MDRQEALRRETEFTPKVGWPFTGSAGKSIRLETVWDQPGELENLCTRKKENSFSSQQMSLTKLLNFAFVVERKNHRHRHRRPPSHPISIIRTATVSCTARSYPPDDLRRACVIVMRSDASTSPDGDSHGTRWRDSSSAADTDSLDFPSCCSLTTTGKSMLEKRKKRVKERNS